MEWRPVQKGPSTAYDRYRPSKQLWGLISPSKPSWTLPVSFMRMRTAFLSVPTQARTLAPLWGPRVPSYMSETLEEVRVSPDSQSTAPQGVLSSVWFLPCLWAFFVCLF